MIERLLFYRLVFPTYSNELRAQWSQRSDKDSWRARSIREALISKGSIALQKRLATIKVLIILCPMFGLLGTVTGMIGVFDIIAFTGANDAQEMAQGVYRATIPTMAGLLVALSGYYLSARLVQVAATEKSRLSNELALS